MTSQNSPRDVTLRIFYILLLLAGVLWGVTYLRNRPSAPKLPDAAKNIDSDAPTEFSSTSSGLKYRVLRKGGGAKPTAASSVTVNYHGWLDNGSVFDSSYDRGQSIAFGLGQVIPGWTEGMQLVAEGGMIELEIPPELGYGSRGHGAAVPPNSRLHFLVELLKVQ